MTQCHFEYLCFLLHMHNFRILSSYIMWLYCVYMCVHRYDYSSVWWVCMWSTRIFFHWHWKQNWLLERVYFPGSLVVKNAGDARDLGLIPGSERPPGGGDGNSLQYSCLEKSSGQRSLVGYSPWGHKEWDTTEWLSTHTVTYYMNDTSKIAIYMCVCVCVFVLKGNLCPRTSPSHTKAL